MTCVKRKKVSSKKLILTDLPDDCLEKIFKFYGFCYITLGRTCKNFYYVVQTLLARGGDVAEVNWGSWKKDTNFNEGGFISPVRNDIIINLYYCELTYEIYGIHWKASNKNISEKVVNLPSGFLKLNMIERTLTAIIRISFNIYKDTVSGSYYYLHRVCIGGEGGCKKCEALDTCACTDIPVGTDIINHKTNVIFGKTLKGFLVKIHPVFTELFFSSFKK
jgi:hypothetical protein